jgi:hypothetical protein
MLLSSLLLTVMERRRSAQTYQAVDDLDFIPMDKFQIKVRPAPASCPGTSSATRVRWIRVGNLRYLPLDHVRAWQSQYPEPIECRVAQFWKLRQAEYESYVTSYYPLKVGQGELSDPLYFDFISFAQYLTISKEIPDAAMVFTESPGVDKEPVVSG